MQNIERLIELTKYKHQIDLKRGEAKYMDINWLLNEILEEIEEVKEEIKPNNTPHLEDELGDILWGWLILVEKLKNQGLVTSHENILKRALKKYQERIEPLIGKPIDSKTWQEVKAKQKKELKEELASLKSKLER
jgi:NTP pyrophosphatase (non-canonical NTP hydrolase)